MGNKESGEKLKKDNIRDYATEAFRFYAACGKLTSEQLKEMVRNEIYTESKKEFYRSGSGMSADATAYALQKAEDVIHEMEAELRDILAVERTMKRLDKNQKKAVEIVYFIDPEKPLERGEITNRVHKAELEIPASEQSVYKWLRVARKIFSEERGLRISERKNNKSKLYSSEPQKSDIMIPSNPRDGKDPKDSAC